MSGPVYLAADLGASSGRVMAGQRTGDGLMLEELSRFPNRPEQVDGVYRWPLDRLKQGILDGIHAALDRYGSAVRSIGVDTWGVDYGLLDDRGELVQPPVAYRDPRVDDMPEKVFARIPWDDLYAETGIQFLKFNTVYQLAAESPETLARARRLLFMPDLLHRWLSGGGEANEYTIASTSQLLNAASRDWSARVLDALALPRSLFGTPVPPGTVVGDLDASLVPGAAGVRVVAPPSHDTASAVAAVPFTGAGEAYLSSGTWSLIGTETREPVLNNAAARFGFTNEGGAYGTIRLLKNICGLWIHQECRREWNEAGGTWSFDDLTEAAAQAPGFVSFIDPDDDRFANPGGMVDKIQAYCRETGQPVPDEVPAVVRCVYESLALRYRQVLDRLEEVTGDSFSLLHVVGGGAQNRLMNQFAASATGRKVRVGPSEASGLGNLMVQMVADGTLASLDEGRALLVNASSGRVYHPEDGGRWADALERFCARTGSGP